MSGIDVIGIANVQTRGRRKGDVDLYFRHGRSRFDLNVSWPPKGKIQRAMKAQDGQKFRVIIKPA